MYKTASLATLALLTLAFEAQAQRDRGDRGDRRERADEPVELKHFEYHLQEFDAPSLESGRGEFGVYLPVGYEAEENQDRLYPWILWLHGMNEDAGRFYYEGGASVLDQLRGEDKLPDLIVIAPSAPRRTIYANGEQDGDIEDYILENVIPYVEENFHLSKRREDFALMGVSMGGMGALRLALKQPDRYGTVAVHSAAAFPADPTKLGPEESARIQRTIQWLGLGSILGEPIDPQKWARYIPSALLEKIQASDLDGLRIYFDAGTADRYGFAPPNEMFHQQLDEKGIHHTFELVEGGGHSWGSGSLQKQLVNSLQFVAAAFRKSDS